MLETGKLRFTQNEPPLAARTHLSLAGIVDLQVVREAHVFLQGEVEANVKSPVGCKSRTSVFLLAPDPSPRPGRWAHPPEGRTRCPLCPGALDRRIGHSRGSCLLSRTCSEQPARCTPRQPTDSTVITAPPAVDTAPTGLVVSATQGQQDASWGRAQRGVNLRNVGVNSSWQDCAPGPPSEIPTLYFASLGSCAWPRNSSWPCLC